MIDLNGLLLHFPKEAVSWRAQNVKSDGTAALALAYIDARDVMERLDAVCGLGGWQCTYPHANGKTICSIGIKCGDEWVWKADGAGDTDVEAEKGAISDAFKRAAVKWGIGRYLYDDSFKNVWVPCESYKSGDKFKFKKFTDDPWKHVKKYIPLEFAKKLNIEEWKQEFAAVSNLDGLKYKYQEAHRQYTGSPTILAALTVAKDNRKAELEKVAA